MLINASFLELYASLKKIVLLRYLALMLAELILITLRRSSFDTIGTGFRQLGSIPAVLRSWMS